jgi:hypothetical protein
VTAPPPPGGAYPGPPADYPAGATTPAGYPAPPGEYLPPPPAGHHPDPATPHVPPAPAGEYVPPPSQDVGDVPLGDLVGQVARDMSTLVRQELALAKAELRQEATRTAKGAGALGGAGVAAFFLLMFLSIALWSGLSNAMDPGWAGLIVALVWAVIGGVLFVVGRGALRQVNPKPERTVDTLSTVPEALKGQRGGPR